MMARDSVVHDKRFAFAVRIVKMAIASKQARETRYWLRLLAETGYLEFTEAQSMLSDCEELTRMLTSIVKTSQEGL